MQYVQFIEVFVMIGIAFMFVLFLYVFIASKDGRNGTEKPEFCKQHSWETKQVDPENEDFGAYFVCKVCGHIPGGANEEHHEES